MPMPRSERVRAWARRLKRDGVMLWFAYRSPETPWLAKVICLLVVAYALSPIDLIPDFIPILGYVDDVLLLPAMIWLAIRLLPPAVIATSRDRAEAWMAEHGEKPKLVSGVVFVAAVWLIVAYLVWRWWYG